MLADVVRTDAHQLRPAAGDSPAAEGIKVLARTRKTLIWERSAVVLRLRAQLREYFRAAVAASGDLDAPDALELLARAPDPARAARLARAQVAVSSSGPTGTRSRSGPMRSWPRCAARNWASRPPRPPPTPLPCGP